MYVHFILLVKNEPLFASQISLFYTKLFNKKNAI